MKNAKLVLFAMILSAPLLSSDVVDNKSGIKKNVDKTFYYQTEDGQLLPITDEDVTVVRGHNYLTQEQCDIDAKNFAQDVYSNNAKKLGMVSGISALGLGTSIAAQHYGKLGQDANITKAQMGLFGSALTTGALALNETRKANAEYVASLPTSLWNRIFGAAQAQEPTVATVATEKTDTENTTASVELEKIAPKKEAAAWLSSRNVCVTSLAALVATFGAQHYTGSKDPKFVQGQIVLGTTAAVSALTYTGVQTYFYNLVFGEKKAK